jgi:Formamidopyrimidine-DNA glycosylase N-terminal domain
MSIWRRGWDARGVPELPEVEWAREALERHALGRVVADADDSDSYVCRPWPPGGLREALVGHRLTGVERVGKQLLVETDGPVLGLHLGMSGSLRFDADPGLRFKRFALAFTDGGNMVLRDPRRLGRVTLDPVRGRLGPDALQVAAAPSPGPAASGSAPATARSCRRPRSAAARPAGAPWTRREAPARFGQLRPRRDGSSAGSQVRPTRNGPKRP